MGLAVAVASSASAAKRESVPIGEFSTLCSVELVSDWSTTKREAHTLLAGQLYELVDKIKERFIVLEHALGDQAQ